MNCHVQSTNRNRQKPATANFATAYQMLLNHLSLMCILLLYNLVVMHQVVVHSIHLQQLLLSSC